jgi:CHAT domain-containing protein
MFQPLKKDDFWGFRFPIGQVYSKAKMVTELRLADGVFASAYSALPHAAEELDLIRHKLVAIKQRLNRDIAFTSLDELAQEIFGDEADSDQRGQRLLMHFLELHFRYGLVHFACHCENPPLPGAVNTAPVASLARLVLMTAKPEKEARLCLNVLDSMAAEKMQFQHRPLVFLNACESDTSLASLQSLNFPKTFIDFGAGGVVATHCTMPDNFAAAFSAHFYNQLLGKPMDEESYIGEALLETRRYFLYERNIPLGLAYGQYTMSDQYLEIE